MDNVILNLFILLEPLYIVGLSLMDYGFEKEASLVAIQI